MMMQVLQASYTLGIIHIRTVAPKQKQGQASPQQYTTRTHIMRLLNTCAGILNHPAPSLPIPGCFGSFVTHACLPACLQLVSQFVSQVVSTQVDIVEVPCCQAQGINARETRGQLTPTRYFSLLYVTIPNPQVKHPPTSLFFRGKHVTHSMCYSSLVL